MDKLPAGMCVRLYSVRRYESVLWDRGVRWRWRWSLWSTSYAALAGLSGWEGASCLGAGGRDCSIGLSAAGRSSLLL